MNSVIKLYIGRFESLYFITVFQTFSFDKKTLMFAKKHAKFFLKNLGGFNLTKPISNRFIFKLEKITVAN